MKIRKVTHEATVFDPDTYVRDSGPVTNFYIALAHYMDANPGVKDITVNYNNGTVDTFTRE